MPACSCKQAIEDVLVALAQGAPEARQGRLKGQYQPLGTQLVVPAEYEMAIAAALGDHLDGVLFVDRLSRLKRELFRRWHKKRSRI